MPNVVIVRSDEHDPSISSVYGHPFVKTPNLERLAKKGTTYGSAYCASPLCCPSRSAFMSGLHVHEIQVYNNGLPFRPEVPSYGDVLRQHGVYTAYFGKLDSYNAPTALGFSEMHGKDVRGPGKTVIARQPEVAIREGSSNRQKGHDVHPFVFSLDLGRMRSALGWLKRRGRNLSERDMDFVLEVNLSKPHFPHHVTRKYWKMYEGHADLPDSKYGPDTEPGQHPYSLDLKRHFQTGQFTEEHIRKLRRGYYGCVSFVDHQLGRIINALEDYGLMDDTILAYTTDHGEMLGRYGMWWKCSLLEPSARIPLIIAGPGFKKGQHNSTAVEQHDLLATMFSALGKKFPTNWHGVPLQDIKSNDPEKLAFCEYHGHGTRASAFMVRKGAWKYIHNSAPDAPHQLFDLASTEGELANQYDNKIEIAEEMELNLRGICDPDKENLRATQRIAQQLEIIAKH